MSTLLVQNLYNAENIRVFAKVFAVGVVAKLVQMVVLWFNQPKREDPWNRKDFKTIPVPLGKYPYFGHAISMGDIPAFQVEKWHQENGPIIHITLGIQHWVIISDPAIAHDIFSRCGIKASGRQRHFFTHTIYTDGGNRGIIFNDTGKKWKNARGMSLSILSPKYVDKFTGVFEDLADSTLKILMAKSAEEGGVWPMPILKAGTFSAITRSLFGKTAEDLGEETFNAIIFIAEEVVRLAGPEGDIDSFFPHFKWLTRLLSEKKAMFDTVANRDKIYKKLITDAVEGDVDCLAKTAYGLKEEYGLDDMDLIIIMNDLFTAGGDPIALSLSWLYAILPHYPEIQRKMCDEIDAFIVKNGHLPSFSDREELPYLIAVMMENLRFRSITNFGVPHYATDDIESLGYFIPKGTVIMNSMHAMHMNEAVYEDPKRFMPERFLGCLKSWTSLSNGNSKSRKMFAFGWGRRICPGSHFSEVEIFNTCVRTLARCTIEPALNPDGTERYYDLDAMSTGLNLPPKEYRVRFVPRANTPMNIPL
ncbi:cytochrome P450 [Phycomyces nitens]|nr:cytochrome P450 [Phycomyces nitens]